MKHKTALTSAMAISGVVVAGTAALAANSGLFDGVGAQPTSSTASTVSVVEVTVPQVDASAPDEVQTFVVDRAGQVVVERKGSALKLRSAASTDGWTAAGSQPSPDKLAITFTKGSESVVFSATGSASGIEASVVEPVTRQVVDVVDVVVPVPAASGGSNTAVAGAVVVDDNGGDRPAGVSDDGVVSIPLTTGATASPSRDDDGYDDSGYDDDGYDDAGSDDDGYDDNGTDDVGDDNGGDRAEDQSDDADSTELSDDNGGDDNGGDENASDDAKETEIEDD